MVTVHGAAATGNTHPGQGIPLPKPAAGTRPPHRPWCTDCKVTHDRDQIDAHGRCPTCGPNAERRAAAAERRRLADLADAQPATAQRKPTTRKAKPPTRTTTGWPRALDNHLPDVRRLYLTGHTAREIGDQYGVDQRTVLSFLRKHDVPIRRRGTRPTKTGATP